MSGEGSGLMTTWGNGHVRTDGGSGGARGGIRRGAAAVAEGSGGGAGGSSGGGIGGGSDGRRPRRGACQRVQRVWMGWCSGGGGVHSANQRSGVVGIGDVCGAVGAGTPRHPLPLWRRTRHSTHRGRCSGRGGAAAPRRVAATGPAPSRIRDAVAPAHHHRPGWSTPAQRVVVAASLPRDSRARKLQLDRLRTPHWVPDVSLRANSPVAIFPSLVYPLSALSSTRPRLSHRTPLTCGQTPPRLPWITTRPTPLGPRPSAPR